MARTVTPVIVRNKNVWLVASRLQNLQPRPRYSR